MISVVTPGAASLTLEEAKAHLRVDHDDDDEVIAGHIAAAMDHFDGWGGVLGFACEEQSLEMTADGFPSGVARLPLGPVTAIEAITYDDASGVEQTLSVDAYTLLGSAVDAVSGWPYGTNVRIRWTAGTGAPASAKHAMLLWIGHLYDSRAGGEMPPAIKALAHSKRVWDF